MKRLLNIIVFLNIFHVFSIAQTDDENLEKYWSYRDRLVRNFMLVGNGSGNSIPMSARRIGFPFGSVAEYATSPSSFKWQDATIYLGHYIQVLATEYRLLANSGGDTQQTLNELYYSIQTLNRLDQNAEPYLSHSVLSGGVNNLNGLFMRDDVSSTFASEMNSFCVDDYSEIFNRLCIFSFVNADYFSQDDWTLGQTEEYKRGNVMSLDQLLAIITALRFVDDLVDPVIVQPTIYDTPLNLIEEVENITIRILAYLNNNDWKIHKVFNQDDCVNNNIANLENLVCTGANCRYFAYPISETAGKILELPVCPNFCQDLNILQDIPHNIICSALDEITNLHEVFSNWQENHCDDSNSEDITLDIDANTNIYATLWETMETLEIPYTTNWGEYIISDLDVSVDGEVCLPYYDFFESQWEFICGDINFNFSIDNLAKPFDDDNLQMMYLAATAGNVWNGSYINDLAYASGIYHIPLMHAVLNNSISPYPWMNRLAFKTSFIDTAP